MKNVLRGLFVAVSLVFMFMLGCMYASHDKMYTNRNFDANVKYFEEYNIEDFVDKSNDDESCEDLVLKLNGILTDYDVVSDIDVDERRVVSSSSGVFKSNEGSVEYTILRVHFSYTNSNNVEDDQFIYFYYQKVNYDRYSLIDVASIDYVTVK